MNKRFIFAVIAVFIAVAGFLLLTKPAEQSTAEPTNHTRGNGSSGVTLVEYADFQCPACGQYHTVLQQIKSEYEDRVTFQFRHFPLETLHKNARAASRAAEAAGNQGKFWEMHDKLFETQTQWQDTSDPLSLFETFARDIGVSDIEKFRTDYRSSEVNAVINADMDEGRKLNVTATPTFFLDGKVLEDNPVATPEAFRAILDSAIAEKSGQPAPENGSAQAEGLPADEDAGASSNSAE